MSDYPSMSHVQHITFEGNDCVVMSPEEYGAALADLEAKDYELSALRAELTEARRQLAAQPAVPEAVAKDAARYRWLRDQHKRHLGLTICKVNMFDLEPWSGDDPDTAIDTAILSATDSEVGK